jgi:hypothetical protein
LIPAEEADAGQKSDAITGLKKQRNIELWFHFQLELTCTNYVHQLTFSRSMAHFGAGGIELG